MIRGARRILPKPSAICSIVTGFRFPHFYLASSLGGNGANLHTALAASFLMRTPSNCYNITQFLVNIQKRHLCDIAEAHPDLQQKTALLESIGVRKEASIRLLSRNSELASHSLRRLKEHLVFYASIGLDCKDFAGIISLYPEVLRFNVEAYLRPAFVLLETVFGKGEMLRQCLQQSPRILASLPEENFTKKLDFLLKLGYRKESKELARALSIVLHLPHNKLEDSIRGMSYLGIRKREIHSLFRAQPALFEQPVKDIQIKVSYFLYSANLSVEELVKQPSVTLHCFHSRIKPRLKMYAWLKCKGLMKRRFKLSYILSISEAKFLRQFVESTKQGPRIFKAILAKSDKGGT